MNAVPELVVLEVKDGRRFFYRVRWAIHRIDAMAQYRTRMQTGHFDLQHEPLRIQRRSLKVYRQRRGRSEPRWAFVPPEWRAFDPDANLDAMLESWTDVMFAALSKGK